MKYPLPAFRNFLNVNLKFPERFRIREQSCMSPFGRSLLCQNAGIILLFVETLRAWDVLFWLWRMVMFDFQRPKHHNGAVNADFCFVHLFSVQQSREFSRWKSPSWDFRLYLNEIDSNLKHRVDYFKAEEENASFWSLSGFVFGLLKPDAKRMTNTSLTLECC